MTIWKITNATIDHGIDATQHKTTHNTRRYVQLMPHLPLPCEKVPFTPNLLLPQSKQTIKIHLPKSPALKHSILINIQHLPVHHLRLPPIHIQSRRHNTVDRQKKRVPPQRHAQRLRTVVLEDHRRGEARRGEEAEMEDVLGQVGRAGEQEGGVPEEQGGGGGGRTLGIRRSGEVQVRLVCRRRLGRRLFLCHLRRWSFYSYSSSRTIIFCTLMRL